MTAVELALSEEHGPVQAWRAEQLELAGYGVTAACELATRQDVDLHVAVRLLLQGCPADLALKILL